MISNRHAKSYNNVSQGIIAFKTSPYFSMGYKFKYFKYTLLRMIFTPLLGYQKISLGNGLSCPPWPLILIDFAQNPPRKLY